VLCAIKIVMDNQPILKTERLVLRPFVADDATRVEELAGDKRIADVTASIPHPYPKGVAIGWILSHPLKWKKGEAFIFAITLTDTSKLIGCISIMNIRNKNGELGYWIGTEFWNNGYCTEACKCIVNYGFTKLNLNRVYAHHFSRNPASGKVLVNSGLIHIGSSKSECGYQKEIEKTELYEKIRT